MTELASLDGAIGPAADARIPVTDEGLLRGDGAFEVVRVYRGQAFLFAEHLDRMERSAANLRLDGGLPRPELEREAAELLAVRGAEAFDGLLRLVVTRGGRRLLLTEPVPPSPERIRLKTVTYAPTRVLDGVKSLSYAANMLCSRIAREEGFDEALLVTPHGRVLEGPTSSFFWVGADGVLCTPPLEDHVLASITRAHLLELLEVEERSIGLDDLMSDVREAFLASTAREAQSIAAIDDRELGETGEVTRKAQGAFRAFAEGVLGGAQSSS